MLNAADYDDEGRPTSGRLERRRGDPIARAQLAISRILADSPALVHAMPRILETICQTLGWELGTIWTLNEEETSLGRLESWHVASAEVPRVEAVSREACVTVMV